MSVDDSLRLPSGYLSVSTGKTVLEDPYRFYLEKVLKLKSPVTLPLLQGTSNHSAIEVLYSTLTPEKGAQAYADALESGWHTVEAPEERVNLREPHLASGKQSRLISLQEAQDYAGTLEMIYRFMLEDRESLGLRIQRQHTEREASLGELAKAAGQPTTRGKIFDYRVGRMVEVDLATLFGVPVHGYVDSPTPTAKGLWVLDHKTVTHVYADYGDRAYEPSYDVYTDEQLAVYATGTAASVVGFQYFLKAPQRLQSECVVSSWKLEGEKGPGASSLHLCDGQGYAWYALAYRAVNQTDRLRAKTFLRRAAEAITLGMLLLEKGVEPAIAFPPGDKHLEKKSCPFCSFAEDCPRPASATRLLKKRQHILEQDPQARELLELWKHRP